LQHRVNPDSSVWLSGSEYDSVPVRLLCRQQSDL
jgi:hypothetical protein